MSIKCLLANDTFSLIASFLATFSSLNEVSGFLICSKLIRSTFLVNESFWYWFACQIIKCEVCSRELEIYKLQHSLKNRHCVSSQICRVFLAQQRVRRQWKTSFASRSMVKKMMDCFDRNEGHDLRDKQCRTSGDTQANFSSGCGESHLTIGDSHMVHALLDAFMSLELPTLQRGNRTGLLHTHPAQNTTGDNNGASSSSGITWWQEITVTAFDRHEVPAPQKPRSWMQCFGSVAAYNAADRNHSYSESRVVPSSLVTGNAHGPTEQTETSQHRECCSRCVCRNRAGALQVLEGDDEELLNCTSGGVGGAKVTLKGAGQRPKSLFSLVRWSVGSLPAVSSPWVAVENRVLYNRHAQTVLIPSHLGRTNEISQQSPATPAGSHNTRQMSLWRKKVTKTRSRASTPGEQVEAVALLRDLLEAVGVSGAELFRSRAQHAPSQHTATGQYCSFSHCCEEVAGTERSKRQECCGSCAVDSRVDTAKVSWFIAQLPASADADPADVNPRMCLAVVRFLPTTSAVDVSAVGGAPAGGTSTDSIQYQQQQMARVAAVAFTKAAPIFRVLHRFGKLCVEDTRMPHPLDPLFGFLKREPNTTIATAPPSVQE